MKFKTKLMIALLSTASISLCAVGFLANKADPDEGLKKAYENYASATGDEAISYESWLEFIKTDMSEETELRAVYNTYCSNVSSNAKLSYENWKKLITGDGLTVKGTSVNAKDELVIEYTDNSSFVAGDLTGQLSVTKPDGETVTVSLPQTYTVTTVDADGNPLDGIWFQIMRYENGYVRETKHNSTEPYFAETDDNGNAIFTIYPKSGLKYFAMLAEFEESDEREALPSGYRPIFELGDRSEFKNGKNLNITIDTNANRFDPSNVVAIEYSRSYNFSGVTDYENIDPSRVKTESKNTTLKLLPNVYTYFSFTPYPEYKELLNTQAQELAAKVASGRYTVTFTPNNATLYRFGGNLAAMPIGPDGIPSIKISNTNGTENSLEINLHKDIVRGNCVFGLISETGGDFTIKVERVGDAKEPTINPPEIYEAVIPVKAETESGVPMLVPLNGTFNPVLCSDGYYHRTASLSSPKIFVMLTDPVARFTDVSFSAMLEQESGDETNPGRSFFKITEYNEINDSYTTHDFTNLFTELCKSSRVNDQGMYYVDEVMHKFLTMRGGGKSQAEASNGFSWLAPCYYYAPDGGEKAEGEGTEQNPYIFAEGTYQFEVKAINVGKTVYGTFKADSDGAYAFSFNRNGVSISNVINVENGKQLGVYEFNGITYIALYGGATVRFDIKGASSFVSLNVTIQTSNGATNLYSPDTGTSSGNLDSEGVGISKETAIDVGGFGGIGAFTLSASACADGVWIKTSPLVEGNIVIDVAGSPYVSINYDGAHYKLSDTSILIENDYEYKYILLTAKNGEALVDGIYLVNIYYSLKCATTELYTDESYIFVAPEDGAYTISSDNEAALVTDITDTNLRNPYISGAMSYTLYLKKGEKVNFLCSSNNQRPRYPVTIEKTGNNSERVPEEMTLGVEHTVSIHKRDGNFTGTINLSDTGNYKIEIEIPINLGRTNFTFTFTNGNITKTAEFSDIDASTGTTTYVAELTGIDVTGEYTVTITTSENTLVQVTIPVKITHA